MQAGNQTYAIFWDPKGGLDQLYRDSAKSNCSLPSFTNGPVMITQWFGKPYDGDVAC